MKEVAFDNNKGNNNNNKRNKTQLTLIEQLHHTSHVPMHFIVINLFRL